jgi:S-DNA-T family DNA segregation ATPase FtsK/SpoIIIE
MITKKDISKDTGTDKISIEKSLKSETKLMSFLSADFLEIANIMDKNDNSYGLPILLGKGKQIFIQDISNYPNVLIAGTTGSGKTQFIYNQIALWLIRKAPSEIKFIFCGSKPIDYPSFLGIRNHYLATIGSDIEIIDTVCSFLTAIKSLIFEATERLNLFKTLKVRTVWDYNKKISLLSTDTSTENHYLPDIILIVDDLYNFVSNEDAIPLLINLTQINLNTGIYIVAATSQISSSVISRQLKGNFTLRLSMKLMSQSDSKKILDEIGAERLVKQGETIFYFNGKLESAQQPYINFEDLNNLLNFISDKDSCMDSYILKDPDTSKEKLDFDISDVDPFFEDAARLIVLHQQGSTSLIQRKLKLGYNRAGRIIDQLEGAGVIGPFEDNKAREVLISDNYALEQFFDNIKKRRKLKKIEKPKHNETERSITSESILPNLKLTNEIHESSSYSDLASSNKNTDSQNLWQFLRNLFSK